jgi:hypothetical protein
VAVTVAKVLGALVVNWDDVVGVVNVLVMTIEDVEFAKKTSFLCLTFLFAIPMVYVVMTVLRRSYKNV